MKNFDDLFRDASADYAEAPPAAVWEALEKRLDQNKKRRVFPLRWFWYFSIVSFLTLLGASLAWNTIHVATPNSNIVDNANKENFVANNTPISASTNPVIDTKESATNTNTNKANNQKTLVTEQNKKIKHKESKEIASNKSHTRTHKKATTKTAYTDKASEKNSTATNTESDNAPTVGTSAYSYDDFEESTPAQDKTELTAVAANSSNAGAMYVAKKIRKNHIIAVEMTPATPVSKEALPTDENDRIAAATIASTEKDATEENAVTEQPTTNTTSTVATTSSNNKPVAATKEHTSTANTVVASPPSVSASAKAPKKTHATVATGTTSSSKEISNSTANTSNTAAIKQNHKSGIATAQHTASVSTRIPAVTPAKQIKSTIAKATKNVDKQTTVATKNNLPNKATRSIADNSLSAKATVLNDYNKTRKKETSPTTYASSNEKTEHPVVAKSAKSKSTANTLAAKKTEVAATLPVAKSSISPASKKASSSQTPTTLKAQEAATTKMNKTDDALTTAKKEKPIASLSKSKRLQNTAQHPKATTEPTGKPAVPASNPTAKTATTPPTKKAIKKTGNTISAISATPKSRAGTQATKAKIDGGIASTASVITKSKKPQTPKTEPTVSTKGKPAKPTPTSTQTIVAAKPAAKKVPTLNTSNKVTNKAGSKKANQQELDDTETEPTIAATPDIKEAEKKTEVETPMASAKKTETPAIDSAVTSVATNDTTNDAQTVRRKFVAGIKSGYESGIGNNGAGKAVIAPYLQYNLGGKLSLMIQPSLKASHLKTRNIGNSSTYYDVKAGSGNYSLRDSAIVYLVLTGDTLWRRNYNYTEKYDSIIKSNRIGGNYVELELPLLLQYQLTPKLSVYGGVNTVFSKLVSIKEDTRISKDLTATGSTYTLANINAVAPTPIATGITYTGNPYSGYNGPQYPSQQDSKFRMGYMLGFSYEIKKRWLADVLLQQTFIKPNNQAGYNVNSALSMPYIRLTLGYRLTK